VASPDAAEGSLPIGQDAKLRVRDLAAAETATFEPTDERPLWLHLARGAAVIDGFELRSGDALAYREAAALVVEARESSQLLLFELPAP
jgi:redox-sensitive bicupin YhaK (pirin superfamily)